MTEREQFEAWFDPKWPKTTIEDDNRMFSCWQASRRAALESAMSIADTARGGYSAAGLTPHAAGAWCVHEEIRALLKDAK